MIRATLAWTIGGADTGPESFSDVRAVAVDSRRRLYVLEAREREVRVFDSTGRFVRSIGRAGRGPGEFTRPNGLAMGPGDRLHVYDPSARRVTVFDTSGAVEATHYLPIHSRGPLWEGGVDSLGRVIDLQPARGDTTAREFVRRLDFGSNVTDSQPIRRCDVDPPARFLIPGGGAQVPFAPGRYLLIDPRGAVWCAHTSRVVAYRIPLDTSQSVDSFVSSAAPVPVAARERNAAVEPLATFLQLEDPTELEAMVPGIKPVLEALDVDDAGRLWMRVADSSGVMVHVFEPTGEWIARVALPIVPVPYLHMAISGSDLYAVTADSLDVPAVHHLKVGLSRRASAP